jgi:hypothetical protein
LKHGYSKKVGEEINKGGVKSLRSWNPVLLEQLLVLPKVCAPFVHKSSDIRKRKLSPTVLLFALENKQQHPA